MDIVIKLPNNLKEKMLTFPMLHVLEKELRKNLDEEKEEQLNIHLMSLKDNIDVLNLLPFSAYYHEFELDDLKTVFTMHRACVNFPLNNVDIFLSTTESFVDASIGKTLKAPLTIGYGLGKNKFLLKKKVNLLAGRHKADQAFNLLSAFVDDIPAMPSIFSREVPPHFADWNINPYFIINLSLNKDKEIDEEWAELIDLLERQNIVLMCDSLDQLEQKEVLEKYLKTLSVTNTYKVYEYKSNIEFAKVVSYSWTFISKDSPLVHLTAYCGSHCFYLNSKENIQLTGPLPFVGEVRYFNLSDSAFKEGSDFAYGKIFDEIYAFIDKKTEDVAE